MKRSLAAIVAWYLLVGLVPLAAAWTTLTTTCPTTTTTTIDAATWLQDVLDCHPDTIRRCQVGETSHGRGLVASQDLPPHQVVLQIPMSEIKCRHMDETTTTSTSKQQQQQEDTWAGPLAKQVLQQIDTSYVRALPPPPRTPAQGDWPSHVLKELENPAFVRDIEHAQDWRYHQWEQHCGSSYPDRQPFLDALDLVGSRTIRSGHDMLLVPLLDMANHQSRPEGGGYYQRHSNNNSDNNDKNDNEDTICLHVGERGVQAGQPVTLDYGSRSNEDWLLHYGFLPSRNTAETVALPHSGRVISWDHVRTHNVELQRECAQLLHQSATTLSEDVERLADLNNNSNSDNNHDHHCLQMALQYRVSRKLLLSAVAQEPAASTAGPAMFSFASVSAL